MVWSGLKQYQPRKKEYFSLISESFLTSFFKYIMTNPWINEYQNWNTFCTPNISHSVKIQKIFAACGVIRGPGYSTFEIFDVARGQKKALSSFDY